MKSRLIALTALLAACVALAACEKKQETAPTAATSSAAPTTAAAPKVELTDEDIAVPEDFLEEATTQITSANYKAEIDALEKDIAATPQ
ncbi:MAG TPA: hypothetical protein PLI95_07315 [Polyangiaceae bacterium]|nr:hypothetical protein [Polyangiaceae bacterium]